MSNFEERFWIAFVMTIALIVGLAIASPKDPAKVAAAETAKGQVPEGAALIYQNDENDHAKRVIKIERCYFTEEFWDGKWVLMNEDGRAMVQCVP